MSQAPAFSPTPLQNSFTPEQMRELHLWSFRQIRTMAQLHKALIALLTARITLFLTGLLLAPMLRVDQFFLLACTGYLLTALPAAAFIVMLSLTMRTSTTRAIAKAALSLLPFVGSAVTILQNRDATRQLRSFGMIVGWTGTSRADMTMLRNDETYVVREENVRDEKESQPPVQDPNEWSARDLLPVMVRLRRGHYLSWSLAVLGILIVSLTPIYGNQILIPLSLLTIASFCWWVINRIMLMHALRMGPLLICLYIILHLHLVGIIIFLIHVNIILRRTGFQSSSFLGPSRHDIRRLREQIDRPILRHEVS